MIEKPGFFYIGKEFSMKENKTIENPILYDSRDLTTHAVCIGMTGSGKTGLCIDILEEATLNRIPCIIIDPKGDMTNLLLAFPELLPRDFFPWLNPTDAKRAGMDLDAYSEKISNLWKTGLNKWGIEPERIRRYKESAEFRIYTPGSKAGNSVSIVSSLLAPQLSWDKEEETLREKIRGTVSALLGLINYSTDPIRSKEHILLSNIFEHFWRKGEDLSLEKLIAAIGNPPFKKLGVLSIDTFIPRKERQKFLLDLNAIIASPSFSDWLNGQTLDIDRFLRTKNGKPGVSIFYTAHLSDNEKIFFTSLLLEEMLSWVRAQPGTNDLKSLLYIDEVFGYIPPYPRNPPTKKPLLLLFKQARAFGTGVILTTQNPVDIDYKALTNAGTWFIGKLQTERDKERLLEGLETVTEEGGEVLDRRYLDHLISSLKKRVFIHHNVHNEKPELFMTRWAMSYLKGPLTKEQIKKLRKVDITVPPGKRKEKTREGNIVKVRPKICDDFSQFFLPPRYSQEFILKKQGIKNKDIKEKKQFYSPYLFAKCNISIDKTKPPIAFSKGENYLCPCDNSQEFFIWKKTDLTFSNFTLSPDNSLNIGFELASYRVEKKEGFKTSHKKLLFEVMREGGFVIYYCPELRLYSDIEENLEGFEDRCDKELEKIKDDEIKKLQRKFEKKIDRIQDRIERKKMDKERYEEEASARKREEYISGAETAFSWIFGRRSMRGISTASRKRRMRRTSEERAKEADAMIKNYKGDLKELKGELEEEMDELEDRFDDALEEIRPIEVKLRKKDIAIVSFGLVWIPVLRIDFTDGEKYFNTCTSEMIERR